jgi:endonuclease YncB( thermonuclease family)
MKFLILFLFLAAEPREITGQVIRVHDGDGCVLRDDAGREWTLRYAGIDAPELAGRSGPRRWPEQPWAQAARQANARLIDQQRVRAVIRGPAAWGRYAAEVYDPRGEDVRRALVRDGLAWVDRRYTREQELLELEARARRAGRGLWSDPRPISPDQWRHGNE